MFISRGDRVLIDTGFFVALANTSDAHREVALDLFDLFKERDLHLTTSDYVLDEAVTTAFVRTKRKETAYEVADMILNSKYVKLLYTNEELVASTATRYRKYHDKSLSFTDCLLLVLAEREKIELLVTFEGELAGLPDAPRIVACTADLESKLSEPG